jgi:transcriptional regulator NrdR family protein
MNRLLSDATKSIMICPNCNRIGPCPVVKSEGNMFFTEQPDIKFRKRKRACSACLQVFYTAENNIWLLEELLLKRNQVQKLLEENEKLKRKVHDAQKYLIRLKNRLSK